MLRGQSVCLLCRQPAVPLTSILGVPYIHGEWFVSNESTDLNQKLHRAPKHKDVEHLTFWYHAKCFEILKLSYHPSERPDYDDLRVLASAIPIDASSSNEELVNKPTQAEGSRQAAIALEGLLCKQTRNCLKKTFSQDLLRQLPVEIILMIAEFVSPCWFLTLLGETRRLLRLIHTGVRWFISKELELKEEAWITKIHYQGIAYVSGMDNVPAPYVADLHQYHIKLPEKITKFVASVDSVGVRAIQFIGPGMEAQPDGSPGYRIIDAELVKDYPSFSHSSLFITGMEASNSRLSNEARIWNCPVVPRFNHWNIYPEVPRIRTDNALDYFEFNSNIHGLLVCCASEGTIGIHDYSGKSKRFVEFVTSTERRAPWHGKYWIYYPFSRGEQILAAWIRKRKNNDGFDYNNILVIQTSLGKIFTFGPQIIPSISHLYEHRPLVREGDGVITGMYHNTRRLEYPDGLELGVTCSSDGACHTTKLTPPPLTSPVKIPHRPGFLDVNLYLTAAPLEGLTRVQVFKDRQDPRCPCLGVLLFYSDWRSEALGQVRWDKDMTEEGSGSFAVAAGQDDGYSYVRDFCSGVSDAELRGRGQGWSRLPERGILAWWFGPWGDYLTVLG